jgi:translocator protein
MNQSKSTFKVVESLVNSVMGVKEANSSTNSITQGSEFDSQATLLYLGGTCLQITIMVLTLWGIEQTLPHIMRLNAPTWLPTVISSLVLGILALRSRLFSPLDNTRSKTRYNTVVRPSWAPPPLAFPIVWMTIGVLRVIASVLVWQTLGQTFLGLPLIAFVIHLALGDTWNTIFTVEGRLGAAVPIVIIGPWLSAIIVTGLYWKTNSVAGLLMAPSVIWLTIASLLVYSIWRLNGAEPLYPLKRETE